MAPSNVDVAVEAEVVALVLVVVVVPESPPLRPRKLLAMQGRVRAKEEVQDLEVAKRRAGLV